MIDSRLRHRLPALLALAALGSLGANAGDAVDAPGRLVVEETAAEASDGMGDDVLVRVNGESILLEDVAQELGALHGKVEEGQRSNFDIDRLVFRIVSDTLLAQEARAMELDRDESVTSQVAERTDELCVLLLESEEIEEKSRPTEDEIRGAYEEQYRRATLRVVTLDTSDEANQVLKRVVAGEDMAAIARSESVDPYQLRDGLMSSVPRRDLLREIATTVFAMEPGEVAGPIRSDLGWSVIRLESSVPADPAGLDAVREYLSGVVRFDKAQSLRAELSRSASEKFPVTIDKDLATGYKLAREPDGRFFPEFDVPDETAVARIGEDEAITVEEYGLALRKRWKSVRIEEAARAAATIILEGLVRDRLILADARRRGYQERPRFVSTIRAFENQLLVARYLKVVVADGLEATPDELRAYYDEHKDVRYRKPPRVHLGQITVTDAVDAARIAGLLRDGTDLAWLARQHSTDRFAASGGNRGWEVVPVGGGSMSRLLLAAEPGDVFELPGDAENFVVLKITARQEQGIFSFDEISGNVRQAVIADKFRVKLEQYMGMLRARSEIEINEELVDRLQISGSQESPAKDEGGPHGGHGH